MRKETRTTRSSDRFGWVWASFCALAVITAAGPAGSQRVPSDAEIDRALTRLAPGQVDERIRLLVLQTGLVRRSEAARSLELAEEVRLLAEVSGTSEGRALAVFAQGVALFKSNRNEEAIETLRQARQLAQTAGEERILGISLVLTADVLVSMARIDEAIPFLEEGREIVERTGTDLDRSRLHNTLARLSLGRLELDAALKHFLISLRHAEATGLVSLLITRHYNLGTVQWHRADFDAAFASYRRALELTQAAGRRPLPHLLFALGEIAAQRSDPESARRYHLEGVSAAAAAGDSGAAAYGRRLLGDLAFGEGRLDAALKHYLSSLDYVRGRGNAEEKASSAAGAAKAHLALGNVAAAFELGHEALRYSREIDMLIVNQVVFEILSSVYEARGDFPQALTFQRRYTETRLAIEAQARDEDATRLQMEHRLEMERRDQKLELERQRLGAERELERQRDSRRALVFGFSLVLLIALLLFNRFRLKSRQTLMLATVNRERQVSARLREIDKLKDEFLANTSHELRTPLYGITGLAESLVDGARGEVPQTIRSDLSMIASSGRRLSHLVGDILDFSKLRHHGLELDRRPVDLRPLVDVILTLSRPLIGSKDVAFENAVPPDLPPADADENRLQQILHNLIGNAVKFTESGSVKISAEVRDGLLVASVKDTGAGIAKDRLAAIFEAFEQADASTERDYGGTGLGLAVTRQLVELHGGRIWVDSRLGEGSTFFFSLPISEREATAVGPAAVATPRAIEPPAIALGAEEELADRDVASDGGRILVVDDEPVNRRVLRNYLAFENFELALASSGSEALRLLGERTFDLVLLDVMMPKMSGYQVCRIMRASHSLEQLPVIFLTAKNRPSDVVAGLSLGANDYLTKPISKGELLARVRPHLDLVRVYRNLEGLVEEKMSQIKVLRGLLPICVSCKMIRDDDGSWSELELFIDRHSEAHFSHGLCPDCLREYRREHRVEGS